MADEVHVSDVGTVFEATVTDSGTVVNIATANPITMTFKKPDGTTVSKTAVLSGAGTDGKMRYTTIAGDLNQPGRWTIQGVVTISGSTWHTDYYDFWVFPNLA